MDTSLAKLSTASDVTKLYGKLDAISKTITCLPKDLSTIQSTYNDNLFALRQIDTAIGMLTTKAQLDQQYDSIDKHMKNTNNVLCTLAPIPGSIATLQASHDAVKAIVKVLPQLGEISNANSNTVSGASSLWEEFVKQEFGGIQMLMKPILQDLNDLVESGGSLHDLFIANTETTAKISTINSNTQSLAQKIDNLIPKLYTKNDDILPSDARIIEIVIAVITSTQHPGGVALDLTELRSLLSGMLSSDNTEISGLFKEIQVNYSRSAPFSTSIATTTSSSSRPTNTNTSHTSASVRDIDPFNSNERDRRRSPLRESQNAKSCEDSPLRRQALLQQQNPGHS